MDMKRRRKDIIAFVLALALLLTLSWAIAWLFMPVRTEFGCMWDSYKEEERDSIDLMFVGTSHVYCDVIPAYVWAQSGISSYVVAGPEQTTPISYYAIREACKTQSPRYLMLEVSQMFIKRYGNYTLANISYMPLSANRIGATFAGAKPGDWFGLLYPLYSYHSRWESVTSGEIAAHFSASDDRLAGYTLLTDAVAVPEETERDFTADSDDYRNNLKWLEKIRDFCAEEGIELIPYIAPVRDKIPQSEVDVLRADLTALGLPLHDFCEIMPELGIANEADWYDPRHFNLRGAVKFSSWLGKNLESLGIVPTIEADETLWTERLEYVAAEHEKLLGGI